jgi:hypothetical protein
VARHVGNIEIGVDVKTGRLVAQLRGEGTKAGKAFDRAFEQETQRLKVGIGKIDGRKEAEQLRLQLEAQLRGIAVSLDMDKARQDLREFEALTETIEMALDTSVELDKSDLALIRKDWRAFKTKFEADKLQAKLEVEMTEAAFDLFRFKKTTEADTLELDAELHVDRLKLRRDLAELEAIFKDIHPNVEMDADTTKASASIASWRERQEANDVDIPVTVHESTSGGGRGLSMRMKAIFAGIVALAEPAAALLQGAMAAAVSVLSSAFSALASTGGAVIPVLAGVGAAAGTMMVGFEGLGTALSSVRAEMALSAAEGRKFNMAAKDIQKAMGALTPSAQAVTVAFADIYPELTKIRTITQESLFSGFSDSLRTLASAVLPDVTQGVKVMAQSFNQFFKKLATAIGEINFGRIFATLQPVINSLQSAVISLVHTFQPFLTSAAPAAQRLAASLAKTADSLAKMVQAGAKSGALTDFFNDGVDSLQAWWGLTRAVGDALATLFAAGKKSGDSFVVSLTKIVEKWDQWMESGPGQAALLEFFNTGKTVMSALVPVLKGLQEGFANMLSGGAIERFVELAENVGAVLPLLGSLFNIVGQLSILNTLAELLANVALALEPVMPAIQELADALGGSLASAVGAVSTLLAPMATAIGVLARVLEPLAPLIVAVGVAWLTWKAVNTVMDGVATAIKGIGIAMKAVSTGLSTGNLVMAGIAAAAGIAMLAYQSLNAESKEIAARSKEVTASLDGSINALLETATQSSAAALGMKALADALANTGEDGEKLTSSLGALGKTTEDTLDVFASFGEGGKDTTKALTELAKSAGLSGEGVADLVAKVESADDPFFGVSSANRAMAESLGISREEMERIGKAMEEVQDQFKKTDVDKVTREWLASSAASSDLNASLLTQAESLAGVSRNADEVVPLYEVYTRLLGENSAEANASAEAADALAAAQLAAAGATEKQSREQQHLNDQLADLADRMEGIDFGGINVAPTGLQDAARDFRNLAKEAEAAAVAADAFTEAYDILIGRNISVHEAMSDVNESIDNMNQAMKDGEAITGQYAATFDTTSDAGRETEDMLLAGVSAIGAWGEAQLTAGMASQDAAAYMTAMRENLVDTASQFFATREEADAYINSLGLTPANIQTIVDTPGLMEAATQILAYDRDLDGMRDDSPVDTEFTVPTLQAVRDQLAEYGVDLEGIDDKTIEAMFITPNLPETAAAVDAYSGTITEVEDASETSFSQPGLDAGLDDVENLDGLIGDLPGVTSLTFTSPTLTQRSDEVEDLESGIKGLPKSTPVNFTTPGLTTAITKTNELDDALDTLSDGIATVTVNGVTAAINNVNTLDRAIDNLRSKTITITQNTVSRGGMTGALITGPRVMPVGEKGYTEALIPLQLPLNRIDPSVRGLAEVLRGGGTGPVVPGTGKIVNNYMTITPQSADPSAVASQIINRSAVMANR